MISYRQADIFNLFRERNTEPVKIKFGFRIPNWTSGLEYTYPQIEGYPWDDNVPPKAREMAQGVEELIKSWTGSEDHGGVVLLSGANINDVFESIKAFAYANHALDVTLDGKPSIPPNPPPIFTITVTVNIK
jgi:hypothetical protein